MLYTAGEAWIRSCDILLWTSSHRRASVGRPIRAHLQKLCTDTKCNLEDLQGAMNDWDEWWEIVREIRASSVTWWWWWCIYIDISLSLYKQVLLKITDKIYFRNLWLIFTFAQSNECIVQTSMKTISNFLPFNHHRSFSCLKLRAIIVNVFNYCFAIS